MIYGRRDRSEKDFVRQVQEILTALLETQRSIPPGYAVDFSDPSHMFTRTSATLYLMLLQVRETSPWFGNLSLILFIGHHARHKAVPFTYSQDKTSTA